MLKTLTFRKLTNTINGETVEQTPSLKRIYDWICDNYDRNYCKFNTFTDPSGMEFTELVIDNDRLILNSYQASEITSYPDKVLNWLASKHHWILGKLITKECIIFE